MTTSSDEGSPSEGIYQEAIDAINKVMDEAKAAHIPMANAASLATVSSDYSPSVRTVTICDVNSAGLLLFINNNSGKAHHISQQPNVGLCFYWHDLHLQLAIQGSAVETDVNEANLWWKKQDRNFQLAAWASSQPRHPAQQRASAKTQFADERLPMPAHWTAYRIKPFRIEFWEANWKRASSHYCYEQKEGLWGKSIP
jgi:pyridoxine/pyridoxamine 5'-phosphate oxidase